MNNDTDIPGLPDRSNYGDLSRLKEDTISTLVRQRHKARRAGLHEDLRIGGPTGLFSWAVPKFLPEDNTKHLAIRQPIHNWSYKDFQGQLNHGYGNGSVEKIEESPVVILKNTGDHLMFTRGDSQDAPIYSMRRTTGNNWLVWVKQKDQPPAVKMYPKEHFKSVPMSAVPAMLDRDTYITKKIDGAGMLLALGAGGLSAYGIRTGANGQKPEYTDIIGKLRSVKVPQDLQGTVLRGEVFGQHNGKSIPASELGGILNSNIINASRKRYADGIRLLVAALAVHENGQDNYDPKRVADIVSRLNTDKVKLLKRYYGKNALAMLRNMQKGDDPLTQEGVVIHRPGQRPIKAKFKDDYDVIIRRIFKADTDKDNRAGGFEYSLPDSRKIIGRVGTGFDHAMLRDMMQNPSDYIGRTARIQSQEQFPSGAFRAPSFQTLKED